MTQEQIDALEHWIAVALAAYTVNEGERGDVRYTLSCDESGAVEMTEVLVPATVMKLDACQRARSAFAKAMGAT